MQFDQFKTARVLASAFDPTETWAAPEFRSAKTLGRRASARCLRAEHHDDLQIFGAVLDEHDTTAQRFGQRRIDHDFCRGLWLCSLSDGVGRPQNGYHYDKAEDCSGHLCFS